MKVKDYSVFMGDDTIKARHETSQKNNSSPKKSINVSGFNQKFDPIAAKKAEAQKKAMKIVGDVYANEKKIDDGLDERRQKIQDLKNESYEATKAIKEIEDNRAKLRDEYGVDADSQEEKDLKLLEKEMDSKNPGSGIELTDEEKEAIAKIKENGLTDYQKQSLGMKESEAPYRETIQKNEAEIQLHNSVIRETGLERLKHHEMTDAQKEKDEILEAASKEIIGMLMDEAKDHIDEEQEKLVEAAKEKAEEEKELKEKLEKAKEEKEKQEELTEDIIEATEEMAINGSKAMSDVQAEVKEMMSKMKLIEDDIKGAEVDRKV